MRPLAILSECQSVKSSVASGRQRKELSKSTSKIKGFNIMQNPQLEEKVNSLLKQMTLVEKVGQLHQTHRTSCPHEKVTEMIKKGQVGSVLLWGIPTGGKDDEPENDINAMQKIAVEESRLGIPILFGLDVIHGLRTVFPVPLGMAATWSRKLAEATASMAAAESASVGVRWTFTPMLDISRDPRWGRIAESFGEDTYLCAELAKDAVRGYQGEELGGEDKILACAKHFAGYGAAEGGRDHTISSIPERMLNDIYLPPFEAAVKAGAGSVMSAFNDIDGVPCTVNRKLLIDILREKWGFDGFVVTDWQCVDNLHLQGIAKDRNDAAKMAITSGIDMDMVDGCFSDSLTSLVESGEVPVEVVDNAVKNILKIKFQLGLFEQPYADFGRAKKTILCGKHKQIALEAAEQSIVLLRNEDSLLPLKPEIKKIAVAGPMVECRKELNGCWDLIGRAEDAATILECIKETAPEGTEIVRIANGFEDTLLSNGKLDAVVLVVGEHPKRSGEGKDITSLKLPSGQEELVRKVHAAGIPVVMVVIAGRQLELSWAAQNIPAILYAWHPGTMGGQAIANILFGKTNPSGKTPVTFPRHTGQVPIYYNCRRNIAGKPAIMQPYLEIPEQGPLFPFGYGLSYTTFDYGNLKISPAVLKQNGEVEITAEITNSGDYDGEEIVQLYVKDCAASVNRPVKELKGFDRVFLKSGETKTVSFILKPEDLAFTRLDMTWGTEPGEHEIWIGPNSSTGLKSVVRLT